MNKNPFALHQEIVAARDEADRCRRALRQWSGAHTHCHFRPIESRRGPATNSPNWALRVGGQPDRRTHG